MNNQRVCDRFVEGLPGTGSHLTSTGTELYSYAYRLAWHDGDRIVVNEESTGKKLSTYSGNRSYDAAYSPSTMRHRRLLSRAMHGYYGSSHYVGR